jgi:hypothetical protein
VVNHCRMARDAVIETTYLDKMWSQPDLQKRKNLTFVDCGRHSKVHKTWCWYVTDHDCSKLTPSDLAHIEKRVTVKIRVLALVSYSDSSRAIRTPGTLPWSRAVRRSAACHVQCRCAPVPHTNMHCTHSLAQFHYLIIINAGIVKGESECSQGDL